MVFCNSDYSNFIITGGKEMKVFICDRCKKEMKETEHNSFKYFEDETGEVRELVSFVDEIGIDLCFPCAKELDDLINNFISTPPVDFPNNKKV